MLDIDIRTDGVAGRITLRRAEALNALTWEMCRAVTTALSEWAEIDSITRVIIDADGPRAFCAGGDIAEMYAAAKTGDFRYGRGFWSDEYRMNAALYHFPKPVITFMQGYTLGGGVGLGCHGSHRIVSPDSQIAMPECGIGIVPDVGGSLILARAPGRLGEYLAMTGHRLHPGDAIYAGFADYVISAQDWPALKAALCDSAALDTIDTAALASPPAPLAEEQAEIDRLFAGETLADIIRLLETVDTELARRAQSALNRNAPLAMAAAIEIQHRIGPDSAIEAALTLEHRFTYRAFEQGDFIEGVRAQIIDKDRAPKWQHHDAAQVTGLEVSRMLMPLGAAEWKP